MSEVSVAVIFSASRRQSAARSVAMQAAVLIIVSGLSTLSSTANASPKGARTRIDQAIASVKLALIEYKAKDYFGARQDVKRTGNELSKAALEVQAIPQLKVQFDTLLSPCVLVVPALSNADRGLKDLPTTVGHRRALIAKLIRNSLIGAPFLLRACKKLMH